MSGVNAIHAGWTGYMKVNGTALNLFMARNCKGNESTPVREMTSNPAVMSYIARNKIAIAIANDIINPNLRPFVSDTTFMPNNPRMEPMETID